MSINILEMLQSQIGGAMLQQAGRFLGEEEQRTQQAMQSVLPAILASAMQRAEQQSGAVQLMNMLSEFNFDGGIFNKLSGLFSGGNTSAGMMNIGHDTLRSLMGQRLEPTAVAIAETSGIRPLSSESLLSLAAPLVMSMIGKVVKNQGLGATGLQQLLLQQMDYLKAALPAPVFDAMHLSTTDQKLTAAASSGIETSGRSISDTTVSTNAGGGGLLRKVAGWAIPVALVLVGLYFVRGCGGHPLVDLAEPRDAETKTVATAEQQTAASYTSTTSNQETQEAQDDYRAAMRERARQALTAIPFQPGSVGEQLSQALATEEDLLDRLFVFQALTFASGSAEIAPTSRSEIENVARVLLAYKNVRVEIEGHTDNTGNRKNNKTLSKQRAEAIKAMLIQNGVDEARLQTKGYGSEAPVATNKTAAGRKENRRIAVKIIGL
ncbi:MAG: OmpA family protein [Bacteroidota bacterium]